MKPERLVLYGTPGVGKSSAAASFPGARFVPVEDGLDALPDAAAEPQPKTWEALESGLDAALGKLSAGQTLVLDTLDAAERLCWAYTCAHNHTGKAWKSIEAAGYGKGYVAAAQTWLRLRDRLDKATDKGVHVVVLAHARTKLFNNPRGDDYMRYQMKLHDSAAALFFEWAADAFFCQHETYARENDAEKVKGQTGQNRLAFTTYNAAYDAKFRLRVPPEIVLPDPAAGGSFYEALQTARLTAAPGAMIKLREDFEALFPRIRADKQTAARANFEAAWATKNPAQIAPVIRTAQGYAATDGTAKA